MAKQEFHLDFCGRGITVETGETEMDTETEGTVQLSVEFPDYKSLYLEANESEDPEELRHVLALIEEFLRRELKLELNPKTTILAAKNGINFVGYIHFKNHKRVRKDAMRRLKKLLKAFDTGEVELEDFDRSIESRFGHMKHADSYILIEETKEKVKEIKERKATA